MARKIRMGMVGGGRGAFIGTVHRMAAAIDNEIELVCGAFSSDPKKSRLSGKDWYLPKERSYGSFEEMILSEKELPEGERMDMVCIVTPNHLHFPPAALALKNGFHVMSDKPMTYDVKEARELRRLVKKTGLLFGLTHNYTGYPLVKEARDIIKSGGIGSVRKVVVEYPQGWLATLLEKSGQKQADWRTDPKRAGSSCCYGDIGTHCENLMNYMTGTKIKEVCAEFTTFVKGRKLEDDCNVLLRLDNGGRGILHCSQISVGEENNLNIRVYGEKGGLEWHQQEPNTLVRKYPDQPTQIYRTANGYLGASAAHNTRIPPGHPEGYLEAFGNLYRNYANALRAVQAGRKPKAADMDFPGVEDGLRGMCVLDAVVTSAKAGAKWTTVRY